MGERNNEREYKKKRDRETLKTSVRESERGRKRTNNLDGESGNTEVKREEEKTNQRKQ